MVLSKPKYCTSCMNIHLLVSEDSPFAWLKFRAPGDDSGKSLRIREVSGPISFARDDYDYHFRSSRRSVFVAKTKIERNSVSHISYVDCHIYTTK